MTQEIEKITEQQKAALAQLLGVESGEISTQDPRWLEAMQNGVVFTPHIGRWRGLAQLTWQDLGLPSIDKALEDEALKVMKLGTKPLMPQRWMKLFNSYETRLRNIGTRYGIKTASGDFLSADLFHRAIEEAREIAAQYMHAAVEMCADREAYMQELADELRAAARLAYQREKKLREFDQLEDQFVESYTSSALNMVLPMGEIERSFYATWDLTYIPLPSLIASEQAAQEQAAAQVIQAREAAYQARVETDQAVRRAAHEREMLQAEYDATAEMHREVIRAAQAQKRQMIDQFIMGAVEKVYTAFIKTASDISETTNKNGFVHPRSILQLQSAIDLIKPLNQLVNIDDTNQMVAEMERLLSETRSNTKDPATIDKALRKLDAVLTVSNATIATLSQTQMREGRNLESASPTAQALQLRQARQELGLTEQAIPVELPKRQARRLQLQEA